MEEINKLRELFNSKDYSNEFGSYGKLYHNTNENLKAYIPDTYNKRVLTVSSSGDYLLNIMSKGCFRIDTFDINKFSPLFQTLKLCSIRNLSCDDSYEFLNSLSPELYFKFNSFLPKKERNFFNYVFDGDVDFHFYKMFYIQSINNIINNNYFDLDVLKFLKNNLRRLENNHFCTNIYGLSNYINENYDYIFLSNISQYVENIDDFLHFIGYLRFHLNRNGCIYFAYLYEKEVTDAVQGIKNINDNFYSKFDCAKYYDLIDNTDVMSFNSAEYPDTSKDSVLILRK